VIINGFIYLSGPREELKPAPTHPIQTAEALVTAAYFMFTIAFRKNQGAKLDFLHDALATGRRLRTLSIEDAYTREMLAIKVDTSLLTHK
jgi:hypothetical protein